MKVDFSAPDFLIYYPRKQTLNTNNLSGHDCYSLSFNTVQLEPKTLTHVGWVEERRPEGACRRLTQHLAGLLGYPAGSPKEYAEPQPNLRFSLTEQYCN